MFSGARLSTSEAPPTTCERVARHYAPALHHGQPREGFSVAFRDSLTRPGRTAAQKTQALSDVASSPHQDSEGLSSGLGQGNLPSLPGLSEPGRAVQSTAGVLPVCTPPELGPSMKAPAAAGRGEETSMPRSPECFFHRREPGITPLPGKGPAGRRRQSAGSLWLWAQPASPLPPPSLPPPTLTVPTAWCSVFCIGTLARAILCLERLSCLVCL